MRELIFVMILLFLIFFGDGLFENIETVNIGESKSDILGEKKRKYYIYKSTKSEKVEVSLDRLTEDGNLYLRVGSKPTESQYYCKSTSTGRRAEKCSITLFKGAKLYISIEAKKPISFHLKVKEIRYGQQGSHQVEITQFSKKRGSVIYHPKNWKINPTPLIFFSPGFMNAKHSEYKTLLNFIASHGYSVVYVRDYADISKKDIDRRFREYQAIVKKYKLNFNMRRVGLVGYSSGAGLGFPLMQRIIEKGWGREGRLLFLIEPWFAFTMNKSDMKKIVNTNVLFLQFGEEGSTSDPRISLAEYQLLKGIPNEKKDYQVYFLEGAKHNYPLGDGATSTMQGVLKPLDALMQYTFLDENFAKTIALEQGSDTPLRDGNIRFKEITKYDEGGCQGSHPKQKRILRAHDINYCKIFKN